MRLLSLFVGFICLWGALRSSGHMIPFGLWRAQNQLDAGWTPQWSNLKAYWRMNSTVGAIASGATLSDSFATSNGTSSGTGLSYVDAKLLTGVSFDGNRYFTVSRTSPANVCTAMTWMTWVNWNAPTSSSYANLITNWNNCATDASWNVNQAGNSKNIELTFNTTAGSNQYVSSTGTPLNGTWRHIAVTLTAGGSAIVYIDGTQNVTLSVNMGAGICSPSANMLIGGPPCGAALGSGAQLDEMAIWNTALTASEVSLIYNRQKNGP